MSAVHPTILIVDDDDRTNELLEVALENIGAQLIFTNNAQDGMQIAEDILPTLILMDLLLPAPSLKGWDAIQALKSNEQTRDIPILAITASGNEGIMRAMKAGADGFIQKPFSVVQFQRTVAQYVVTAQH